MKEYFYLQFRMTSRKLREAGIHPVFGYLTGLAVFIIVSEYLFQKTEFTSYLVVLAPLSFLFKLSAKNRNDFLAISFGSSGTKKIRIVENIFICLPFIMMLGYHNALVEAAALLALAVVSAVYSFTASINFTIPTPFFKHPFEFTVGFRNSFFVFPVAYLLIFVATVINNMNLGIFSMLLVFLTSLTFFSKPENEYYVWVHTYTPNAFILNKLKQAAINVFLLNSPILTILLIAFTEEYVLILLLFLSGLIFLWTIILGKYSTYPAEMNLPEGILITLCVFFPPLLLALIPFFYGRAVTNLKVYLDDKN